MKSLLLLAGLLLAQPLLATPHKVTLNWVDVTNPNGTTYEVFRATGPCGGTPAFQQLASGVTVLSYVDSSVVSGTYCYEVLAVYNAKESAPSNQAAASIPPDAPASLTTSVDVP
jgi:hypothetical protein